MKYYLGIDIGSISVNTVLIDENKRIIEASYDRIKGEPARTAASAIARITSRCEITANATTGSGGKLIKGHFVNEIIAQAAATSVLHPEVKSVIEIGGEDSKFIRLKDGKLADFTTNTVCAAGTGSFLDQQASRLGLAIEDFGQLALRSKHPPRIAGRCTVFAKSDMIHLQQKGTPDFEIVAGLCFAVARNFISNAGKVKKWAKPISFQGGVAANAGVVKAFEQLLELAPGELIIPEHFASMGAIGAALSLIPPPLPLGEGERGGEG
ncbi:MAG: acyl-CoA dehydratase activase [Candidatus Margulisbacteria bacterium]|nr:acyl-CoA dehydratase activase [Candidatus Margulisiibacteriota bacterium]